jgi:pimeloyl-ACP methyl ester carboxylesterase
MVRSAVAAYAGAVSPGSRGPRRSIDTILCLTWAALASGCASQPVPPGSEPPPGVERRRVELENGFIQLEIALPRTPPGPRPAVIGSLGDDGALLERGIAVVDWSNDWTGVRALHAGSPIEDEPAEQPVGTALLASPRPGVIGRGYFQLVGLAAHETLPAIVEHLRSIPEIDPDRIAVAGSSTRGFMALEALAAEPHLAAGVVRVACGDYHEFLRDSSLALAGDPRWLQHGALVLDPDYEAELRAREPILHAAAYPPRPLLLLAGGRDPVVPVTCVLRTAAVLARAYADAGVPERLRLVLDPDAGHDLGAASQREALSWWERWLLEPAATSR